MLQPCLVQGSSKLWCGAEPELVLWPVHPQVSDDNSVGFADVGIDPSLLGSWQSFQDTSGSEQAWLCGATTARASTGLEGVWPGRKASPGLCWFVQCYLGMFCWALSPAARVVRAGAQSCSHWNQPLGRQHQALCPFPGALLQVPAGFCWAHRASWGGVGVREFSRASNTWRQAQLGSSRGTGSGMTFYLGGKAPTTLLHTARVFLQAWGAVLEPFSFAFPFPFPSHQSFKFCFLWNMSPLRMLYQKTSLHFQWGDKHHISFVYCCLSRSILRSWCICWMSVGLGKWTPLMFASPLLTSASFSMVCVQRVQTYKHSCSEFFSPFFPQQKPAFPMLRPIISFMSWNRCVSCSSRMCSGNGGASEAPASLALQLSMPQICSAFLPLITTCVPSISG